MAELRSERERWLKRLGVRSALIWKLARQVFDAAESASEQCKALAEMNKALGRSLEVWKEAASGEELAEYRRIRDQIKEAVERAHGAGFDDMGEAQDPTGAEPVN